MLSACATSSRSFQTDSETPGDFRSSETDLAHCADSWRGNLSRRRDFLSVVMKCPQPGWPWQSRLSRLKSQGSWTVYTLAAEWNDQNGQLVRWYYASRAILPRPICARGASQHRSPDLAAPRRRVMAGQSPSLETQRSGRLQDRSLPR